MVANRSTPLVLCSLAQKYIQVCILRNTLAELVTGVLAEFPLYDITSQKSLISTHPIAPFPSEQEQLSP